MLKNQLWRCRLYDFTLSKPCIGSRSRFSTRSSGLATVKQSCLQNQRSYNTKNYNNFDSNGAQFKNQSSVNNHFKSKSHILQTLSTIQTKDQLNDFVTKYSEKYSPETSWPPFMQFIKQAQQLNFQISNNLWIHYHKLCEHNEQDIQLVDWAGLYLFRFNGRVFEILRFNDQWRKIIKYSPNLFAVYYSSYIHWLLNTNQLYFAVENFINYLESGDSDLNLLPFDAIITKLIKDEDVYKICKILDISMNERDINLSDENWSKILNLGIKNNSYPIVKQAYKSYLMKGFTDGKISIEEAILSPMLVNKNHIFQSMSDSLLMQILQILSMNGDTKLTIDLIESHFFHKVVAGKSALNKNFCLKIIESHCYDNSQASKGMENVLDLIDTFVRKTKNDPNNAITSQDLFQAMNQKISSYNLGIIDKEKKLDQPDMDEIRVIDPNKESKKPKLVLAKSKLLHDFIVHNISYIDQNDFDPMTKSIFIDCLLNYISTYLNHTGIVKVLVSIHYLNSQNLKNLNSTSYDLILKTLSPSTSKQCALYYFNYFKINQITITPRMYIWLIQSCFNEYYEPICTYLIYNYFKEYESIMTDDETIVTKLIEVLPDDIDGQLLKLKNYLTHMPSGKGFNIAGCFKFLGIVIDVIDENQLLSEVGPKCHRRYYKVYDENDLSKLKKVLPIN
ncbi:hypothetical protein KGF54_002863 [Candida jiufengensis]|uniref:uncharacterized protein n=1 Tax=Candida jiufengensis TaxID=497108 RepID=UPI002224392D|nr:uncharacterized protein KGF54_002863 [Candida jiufengensis]KAI5953491.1 hypothetical protein KGF54_002863 [Candida jiufengensis]